MKGAFTGWFAKAALVLAAFVASVSLGAADEILIDWNPVWVGARTQAWCSPVRFTIENRGKDDRGVLSLKNDGFQASYPLELPAGSKRSFIAYPATSIYGGQTTATLESNQGRYSLKLELMPGGYGEQAVGVIAENPGSYTFLRRIGDSTFMEISDGYCKPSEAPERAIGYASLSALMLGTGAERLTTEAVEAIKLFAAAGGHVVFTGGAATAALNDTRWGDFLPIQNVTSHQRPVPEFFTERQEVTGSVLSLAKGDVSAQAQVVVESGDVLSAERSWGIGRVTFLAYSFTEQPLSRWDGRRDLLMEMLTGHKETTEAVAERLSGTQHLVLPGNAELVRSSSYYMGYSPFDDQESNPFQLKLPPVWQIALILAGFWLVVVPINFGVLSKLGRKELAWLTAPLISLGFAGIFFAYASRLYSATLSTSAAGAVVMQSGHAGALYMGTQQFFFPRPGEYDLDLEGVEIISPADEYRSYYDRRGDSSLTGYVMDNGEIEVPRMKTGSLAFKEAKMQQRLQQNWVLPSNLEVRRASRGVRVTGTIRNDSPNPIVSGSLIVGDALPIVAVRRLEPGETADVNVLVVLNGDPPEYVDAVFEAVMPDLKVGANLGDAVAGRAISIVCGMGTYRVEESS